MSWLYDLFSVIGAVLVVVLFFRDHPLLRPAGNSKTTQRTAPAQRRDSASAAAAAAASAASAVCQADSAGADAGAPPPRARPSQVPPLPTRALVRSGSASLPGRRAGGSARSSDEVQTAPPPRPLNKKRGSLRSKSSASLRLPDDIRSQPPALIDGLQRAIERGLSMIGPRLTHCEGSLATVVVRLDPTNMVRSRLEILAHQYGLDRKRINFLLASLGSGCLPGVQKDLSHIPRKLGSEWASTLGARAPQVSRLELQAWNFDGPAGPNEAVRSVGAPGSAHRKACFERAGWLVCPYTCSFVMPNPFTGLPATYDFVRCGVIDTEFKAEQFASLLSQFTGRGQRRRVRSMSLLGTSVLSQSELEMANKQNRLMAGLVAMGSARSIPFDLVHLNLQTSSLAKQKGVTMGEQNSYKLNQPALLTYVTWIKQDVLEFVRVCAPHVDASTAGGPGASIGDLLRIARTTRGSWSRKSAMGDIAAMHRALSGVMSYLAGLKPRSETAPFAAAAANLLHTLYLFQRLVETLGKQQGLERIEEHMMFVLLDIQLGVVSCVNCKSGCDRSAVVHALTCAVCHICHNYPDHVADIVDMVTDFTEICRDVDQQATSPAAWSQFMASIETQFSDGGLPCVLGLACELRNCFLHCLMEIGWKIVILSTSVPGFKFGMPSDVIRNDTFLKVMPPYVAFQPLRDGSSASKLIPSRNGERYWHTRDVAFRSFLTDASKWRGGSDKKKD